MKTLIRCLIACTVMLLVIAGPAAAQGTQLSVTAGSLHLKFEPGFISYLQSQGISVTFHAERVTDQAEFRVVDGTLDSQTGAGDVHCAGKITFSSGSTTVDLLSMMLDTTDPIYPYITALVVVNGVFVARLPMFTTISGEPYNLPLAPGDSRSGVSYFKGFHYLDYFQVVKPSSNLLVGSYTVATTLIAQ